MAQPDHPARVYPTSPMGYQTDTRAVAAGTAGVLHALHRAGRMCDPAVIGRLRDEALAAAETSAPGLLFGSAGIACVLAELGEFDAAEALLTVGGGSIRSTAARPPSAAARPAPRSACWPTIAAPVSSAGSTWPSSCSDGFPTVRGAHRPAEPDHAARGWPAAGPAWRSRCTSCTAAPATRGCSPGACGCCRTSWPTPSRCRRTAWGSEPSHTDPRVYPYLFAGSAGYAAVLSRYLAHRPDAEFDSASDLGAADALERCLRSCSVRFTAFPGLFPGLAGLAVALAGVGRRLDRPELVDAALTSARGLFRYAIPRKDGVGWLGEPGQRLSADLWSGSAGILLALQQLTDPAPSPLDLLDVN